MNNISILLLIESSITKIKKYCNCNYRKELIDELITKINPNLSFKEEKSLIKAINENLSNDDIIEDIYLTLLQTLSKDNY